MDENFKNKFNEKLKDCDVNNEFIDSLNELIENDNFSSDKLKDLINGEFDE